MDPVKTVSVVFPLAIGPPVGKGLRGLYHSVRILVVGLLTVAEKVTGEPLLQVIAWLVGFTALVGAVVLVPIITTWEKVVHPLPDADTV